MKPEIYVAGRRVRKSDLGYLLFGFHASCPECGDVTPHATRAVESREGRNLEIRICEECRRIERVQAC